MFSRGPCKFRNSFTAETPVHAQDAEGNPKLVAISELKIGDKVLAKSEWKAEGENLSYEPITDIISTPDSEQSIGIKDVSVSVKRLTTYNLEVANAHAFFVGESGVLVHNSKGGNQNKGDSGLCHLSDDEIDKLYKGSKGKEKLRYQREQKHRKNRNQSKRRK